ncbi:serine hydrolase [Amycolatopsis sp. WGS_07]
MTIQGAVKPGYEGVREAFGDILETTTGGAAFSVFRDGAPVVELWGGSAAEGVPWTEDTRAVLFSGTKGVVATVLAILTARGLLDPDERVARYWPEFAEAGKEDVRVSQLLSHTVGLPYVEPDLPMLDNAANARALAAQRPLWTPGTKVAYHALTYGYLATELTRRVTGADLGTHVRALLAEPHGLDLRLGTPATVPVATLRRAPGYRISTFLQDEERRRIVERMYRGLLDSGDSMNSPNTAARPSRQAARSAPRPPWPACTTWCARAPSSRTTSSPKQPVPGPKASTRSTTARSASASATNWPTRSAPTAPLTPTQPPSATPAQAAAATVPGRRGGCRSRS